MPGFVEIYLVGDGATISCRAMVPEIAAVCAAQGIDPRIVNRLHWPAYGASRWATGHFLLHSDDLQSLANSLHDGGYAEGKEIHCDLSFGGLLFRNMLVGKAIPLIASEGSGAFFLVRLHCRRWAWQRVRARPPTAFESIDRIQGYNMLGSSRGRLRRRTLNAGALWTPRAIVERVLLGDPANGIPALQRPTDQYLGVVGDATGLPLESTSLAGVDFDADDSAPGMIDRVLAKSGAVLLFAPSVTSGKIADIAIHVVGGAESRAISFLNANGADLVGGGLETLTSGTLTGGAKASAYANSLLMRSDIPEKVRVYFPLSRSDLTDEVLAECNLYPGSCAGIPTDVEASSVFDVSFATLPAWDSSNGRPFGSPPDAGAPALFHVLDDWPAVTELGSSGTTADVFDATRLQNRADAVAKCYYSRFSAGCGDLWFRDHLPLLASTAWAGALHWEWFLDVEADDPRYAVGTHVWGDRDDPIYGYKPMPHPFRVHGLGTVQAFNGPDGSVRIIGHQVGPIPCQIRLTGVDSTISTNRWLYNAEIVARDGADGLAVIGTIKAKNTVERGNTATFAGPSALLPLATAPDFAVLPIGMDRNGQYHPIVVNALLIEDRTLVNGKVAEFSLTNLIDGECPTP